MNTSEVINTAADLIEERGWGTGIDSWGTSGSLCIEGGIIAAAGLDLAEAIGALHETCPAYRAVMEYIGVANIVIPPDVTIPEPRLWMWNDAIDDTAEYVRTAAEVIETLRAAALVESARESAALLAEMGR